ncbi:hypothetical protein SBFV3_gp36 [Sulfolobales Beppu filamentous virus 3]|uniref:Uncharacterized protein n=1 Tax=Sulfolobales Beppu filamentous virus 3 TaxID=2493124 RepID=A0A3S8NF70_9VIRU|nr:hypothetical protein HOU83_gp36 [Sulfolobales Beppu filamentous virus 3]AZI75871.1 hypothetical protein SBFV3_gp36 [Sulfolobales Beppu filamentous virus 3]
MPVDRELIKTVLTFMANGVITITTGSGATSQVQIAPYQLIAIMKNNNVEVSKTTITSISFSDTITPTGDEEITVRLAGTDSSPFTYTVDTVEIWASTQNALLYRISTISLQTPLQKSEHDYLHVQYELTITAGSGYLISSSLSQYFNIITTKIPVAPILFFFALFIVPNFITVLKQNPTYPLSQLLPYITVAGYPGINTMYVGSEEATILSKLVGYGNGYVNLVVNGEVSISQTNVPIAIGIMTSNGVLVIAYAQYTGTISQYASIEISVPYGVSTAVAQYETQTTGGG